jgi:antitoxin VapB
MGAAVEATRPGQTEHVIASHMARELVSRGAQAVVLLVATDERIFRFRHPLPTDKVLDRYAMLILCGRKWGLVCSVTRLVHFGSLPDEVRAKAESTARVDATFIGATRPGRAVRDVFADGLAAYAAEGFPDEWRLHHQGGAAGYEPREFLGTPDEGEPVVEGQAYAWNPSITGTKSEDTVLVGPEECEVITEIPGWPLYRVEVGGREIARPAILVSP